MGELEDEMRKLEEEDAREQQELRARIKQLNNNVRDQENMLNTWQNRYSEMKMAREREMHLRQSAEQELEMLRRNTVDRADTVPLPPRRSAENAYTPEQDSGDISGVNEGEEVALTCGKCTNETRCACIEEAFEMGGLASDEQDTSIFKRPHSPHLNLDNKRLRQTHNYDPDAEIDFTTQFASRPPPALTTSASTASSIAATAPVDPCGFCSDGTPCICAELSNEDRKSNNVKPPQSSLSMSDQSMDITPSDPCVKGPGTCAQCISDPASRTFCLSVAATRPPATNATKDEMLKSSLPNRAANSNLNCAAAFTMLRQHPSFDTARTDMPSWVPQLNAIARPSGAPARTAFDIEAASVMSVLRLFDRRFGSDARRSTPVSETVPSPNFANRNANGIDGIPESGDDSHAGQFIAYDGIQGAASVRGPDMRSYQKK